MEALAARQLQRQKAKEKERNAAFVPREQTLQERKDLNKMLGFADAPAQVFAIGKDECAAVWWTAVDDESITGWEVHRFRKDKSKPDGDWHCKGFTAYPAMLKNQTVIGQLCNDYEYRFTVKSVNIKGTGIESDPSNAVMVESPLPSGW